MAVPLEQEGRTGGLAVASPQAPVYPMGRCG